MTGSHVRNEALTGVDIKNSTLFSAWSPGGDFMHGTVTAVLQNGVVSSVTAPLGTGKCHVVGHVSAVS